MRSPMKYVLCPGQVPAKRGVQHVTAKQLARLYRVPMSECVVRPKDHDLTDWMPPVGTIELFPRADGDYSIPTN